MKQPIEPEPMWSRSTSAVYGWLSGIAVSAVHQVHFVVSNDVPNDAYMLVVGELAAGAFSGAILFVVVASLRNHLRRRIAATATASMAPNLCEFP
jgi:hypothetical protein